MILVTMIAHQTSAAQTPELVWHLRARSRLVTAVPLLGALVQNLCIRLSEVVQVVSDERFNEPIGESGKIGQSESVQ